MAKAEIAFHGAEQEVPGFFKALLLAAASDGPGKPDPTEEHQVSP